MNSNEAMKAMLARTTVYATDCISSRENLEDMVREGIIESMWCLKAGSLKCTLITPDSEVGFECKVGLIHFTRSQAHYQASLFRKANLQARLKKLNEEVKSAR